MGSKRYIHIEDNYDYNKPWVKLRKTEEESLKALVKLIKRSKMGRSLLVEATKKAKLENKTLDDVISPGAGSLTDTTLIRKFSPSRPDEIHYESHSKVFVNRDLNVLDAALDLAHELTHYTFRTAFNPYRQNFNLKEFVKSTVEGRGGEVDAYVVECRVLYELFPKRARSKSNCHKIMDEETGLFSRAKGAQYFYRVGGEMGHFRQNLRSYDISQRDLPLLSDKTALFISSAYGLPYPVAAMKEYVTIMGKACENDRNRLSLMRQKRGRFPASTADQSSLNRLTKSYYERCHKFVN